MREVSVTDLKNRLSRWLRLVKQGETLVVVERSLPIAQIVAVERQPGSDDVLLEKLIAAGTVTRARRPAKSRRLPKPVPCQGDAVQALIEERERRLG
jgi:prevent-host-death family protein